MKDYFLNIIFTNKRGSSERKMLVNKKEVLFFLKRHFAIITIGLFLVAIYVVKIDNGYHLPSFDHDNHVEMTIGDFVKLIDIQEIVYYENGHANAYFNGLQRGINNTITTTLSKKSQSSGENPIYYSVDEKTRDIILI